MTDMTPDLLQAINAQFDEQAAQSAVIKQAIKKLRGGDATFIDANRLAIEVGNLLAQALQQNISSAVLPDGKLYYNMANRLLNSTLQKNFGIIAGYSTDVQRLLNQQAKIGIKAQQPSINQDRIDGFVNRLASEDYFDDVQWLLNEPIINFSQHIVDDTIDTNVKLHAKAGLHPKITRTVAGKACKWCANLAGSYEYPNDVPDDVYHRHERCRCMVNYLPGDGKRQNVWSKKVVQAKPKQVTPPTEKKYISDKQNWQKNYNRKLIGVHDRQDWSVDGQRYVVNGRTVLLDYSAAEKQTAQFLAKKLGVKVEMIPRVLAPPAVKTPDYLINGVPFDLKQVQGQGKNVIDGMLRKKNQSHNFIFDVKQTPLSLDEVLSRFNRVYANPARSYVDQIILIDGQRLIDIFKRK